MEAKQTPLIDLLESVPRDAVLVVEHDQFSSSSHPVGRLCHEAAAELRRLHAKAAQDEALLRQALEALEGQRGNPDWHTSQQRENAVRALRERLSKGAAMKTYHEGTCIEDAYAEEDVASARSGNVRVVASFATLVHLAAELGQARLSGDVERIERAQKAHDEYRDICLKADEMLLNTYRGGLI